MPLPEEEEEHAAFDDDEDLEDTEGDDTDMDDDDDDGGDDAPPPPPPPPAVASVREDLNSSTPSTSTSSDRTLNPNPNPNPNPSDPPAAPRNGVIPALPLSTAAPAGASSAGADLLTPSPDLKRQRTEEKKPLPSASFDESRRLFQRLWTDDDEIKILKGFLEFTSQRGTTFASHQYDTGPFYEQIKNQLQLDFNKNQLIEKLRRLKKKYRNTANRMASHGKEFSFKSPHEKATYEIAKKIWSASIKRSRDSDDDDLNPYANNTSDAAVNSDRRNSRSRRRGRKRSVEASPALALPPPPPPPVAAEGSAGVVKVEVQTASTPITPMPSSSSAMIPSIVEETVKSCLSPIFKELLNSAVCGPLGSGVSGGGVGLNLPPLLSFGGNWVNSLGCGGGSGAAVDGKWKQQQILELEVYLKRVELVRDQIKSTLEDLRSSPSSGS